VLPDPGSYEERYRLAGDAGWTLFGTLVFASLGSVWHTSVIYTVFALVVAAMAARAGGVFAAARRAVAFRTDYAGITLGAVPGQLGSRRPAVFVPWEDVEQILLYPGGPGGRGRSAPVSSIGIQRRAGAPPLARGNEQAPGCPVPRVAAGASRRITGWRLDRDRLAAVTAAVAPGIPVVDAGPGLGPGIGRPEVPGAGNGA
jgi:hypothetical protein